MKIGPANEQVNALLYHDNKALNEVKYSQDKQEALATAAGQFEAMFLQMVLKQMRSSSDALASQDNPFSSQQQGSFRDMHDAQLTMELSQQQQTGIAEMLIKQLSPTAVTMAQQTETVIAPQLTTKIDNSINSSTDTVAYNQEIGSSQAFQQPLLRKRDY